MTALPRRGFLGRLAAATSAFGLAGLHGADAHAAHLHAEDPDGEWISRMKGVHRQIFDMPAYADGRAPVHVMNWLNTYNAAYGVPDEQLSTAIMAYGRAWGFAFDDWAWEHYGLGEMAELDDPRTRERAKRNIYATGTPYSIDALQQRGTIVLLCNNSLRRGTSDIARRLNRTADEIRDEVRAHLLPGVIVVPAAVIALGRAQEAGVTYYFAG
jgi:intracellular sulfur oxidation DsrE/DsrF family protein